MTKNIATLKSQSRANQGHSRWYHSIDCVCNIVPNTHPRTVFEIFDFKYAVTLKTGLMGPSRSLKMSSFDGAHMTFNDVL